MKSREQALVERDGRHFFGSLPVYDNFGEAVRGGAYTPLPADWSVGFSDVVGSTKAVADGRYKAVNMVGAGVITAVANALGRRPFPFVFGGDGATFAVPASDSAAAAKALAAMATYAETEFKLELRAAMASVGEIRAAGHDVRVARFEEQAKRGRYALSPAPPKMRPDLTGLSCRWGLAPAKNGTVLSVIVAPRGDDPRFPALVEDIVRMALGGGGAQRPVTAERLVVGGAAPSIALETHALKASGASEFTARIKAAVGYALLTTFRKFYLKAAGFDAAVYAADLAANADFHKFDDGLRMTLDCSLGFADELEAKLTAADDYANWGLFRQKAAQITCYSPSVTDRGHVHFVDGADGGYTMAASAMKARRLLKAHAA